MQIDLNQLNNLRSAAGAACSLLQVLANPDRLLLLCHLSQGEKNVSELEQLLDLHQPSLSQQLGVLRRKNLGTVRREGKWMVYSIADEKVLHLIQTLHHLYCPN